MKMVAPERTIFVLSQIKDDTVFSYWPFSAPTKSINLKKILLIY